MYSNKVAFTLASLFLLARADLTLDTDDVPAPCTWICRPIVELTRQCETDLNGDNNDKTEDSLEAQCICTNTSFAVKGIAASCAGCIHVNKDIRNAIDGEDHYDTTDIDDILSACGWPRAFWSNDDSNTSIRSVTVKATAATASSQLTTKATSAATTSTTTINTSASLSGSSSNSDRVTATATQSSGTSAASDSSSSQTNAAPALAPFGAAGAAVAFAGLMLA